MFRDFIQRLEYQLRQALPGEAAQFSMAPVSRQRIKQIPSENYNPKKSAVLILLFPQGGSIRTVLIQRPEYDGVHSGQIAFPGGKFEFNDIDLMQTALRETTEEIGVAPEGIIIIGSLTELYITPSNFLVQPFIGYVTEEPQFLMDPREVQSILTTDVFKLNSKVGEKVILQSGGYKIKTPYYDIEGFTVWGATAMIISEFNAVIKSTTSF
ncbi:MAG: CoA pyrophosphatase [Bacteroidetes bacterium]|nr:CoA pyrophosphatase [Bacteroidota bacterium]